jgi:lipopolysaccharide export system permease protein
MKIFDRYIFKNLLITSLFVSVTLTTVILLTQSLRFLELVIESGASANTFWVLTSLALPRFFEVILPLALMTATIFTYNRMTGDSELVVIRAVGQSPLSLVKPALLLAMLVTCILWSVTMYFAPKSLATLQSKRQEIKAQLSTSLFREGVVNQAGTGLTVYARDRSPDGTLYGLMINDSRADQKRPSTIIAKRGVLSTNEEGFQVTVYDGQRQEYDATKKTFNRLNFDRYLIEIPDKTAVRTRWQQPDERTIFELLSPDKNNARDAKSAREFKVEIHRRIISPLLAIAFTLISAAALLLGPVDRRGQARRIVIAVTGVVIIQGLYLSAFSLARQNDAGLIMMYSLTLLPIILGLILLSGFSEKFRRLWLYKSKNTIEEKAA